MHCLCTRSQISKAGSVICGLLNSFIYNWRVIALHCRVGFCHTSAWISHRYTYVPSLLSSLFYRWGNWSSWRLRDLSKPMLPLHYRAGMWTQVCPAPRCYLTPERVTVEETARHTGTLWRSPKVQRRAGGSLKPPRARDAEPSRQNVVKTWCVCN